MNNLTITITRFGIINLICLISFFIFGIVSSLKAQQIGDYQMSVTQSQYTEITPTTLFPNSQPASGYVIIPTSPFEFLGQANTTIRVFINGYVVIESTAHPRYGDHFTPLSDVLPSGYNILSAFGTSLRRGQTGRVGYSIIDDEIIIQWKGFMRLNTPTDDINFQMIFNQRDNSVRFVYGNMVNGDIYAILPQVGIRGGTIHDYSNLAVNSDASSWLEAQQGTSNQATCFFDQTILRSGTTVTYSPIPCIAPNMTVIGHTDTTIDMNWQRAIDVQGFEVYYDTINRRPPFLSEGVYTTDSFLILQNLQHVTTYHIWARSVCSLTDKSGWAYVGSQKTKVTPVSSFPWMENFESYTNAPSIRTGSQSLVPSTWKWIRSCSLFRQGYYMDTYSGNVALGLLRDAKIITPCFSFSQDTTYRLRFYMNNREEEQFHFLKVYMGTEPEMEQMQLLRTYTMAEFISSNFKEYIVDIDVPESGVYYFAFEVGEGNTSAVLSIDDLTVEYAPNCLNPVSVITHIAGDRLAVSWVSPTLDAVSAYELVLTTTGSGWNPNEEQVYQTLDTNWVFDDLQSNTTYYVKIRTQCTDQSYSPWRSVDPVKTLCGPDYPPYFLNFQEPTGSLNPECTYTQTVELGERWRLAQYGEADYIQNGDYIRLYRTRNRENACFFTNGIHLIQDSSYRVKYWLENRGFDFQVKVAYGLAPDTVEMTNVLNLHGQMLRGEEFTTDFVCQQTGVYYFGIHGFGEHNTDEVQLDNLEIFKTPHCVHEMDAPLVRSVGSNTVVIDWQPIQEEGLTYEYYFQDIWSSTPGHGMTGIAVSDTNDILLEGLLDNKRYSFWMRTVCSEEEKGMWSPVVQFHTLCGINSAPTEVEDFGDEAISRDNSRELQCWTLGRGVDYSVNINSSVWSYRVFPNGESSTNRSAALFLNSLGNTSHWLISKAVDLGNEPGRFDLKFDGQLLRDNNLSDVLSSAVIEVLISTDGGQSWSAENVLRRYYSTYLPGLQERIGLDGYSGVVKFAFKATVPITENNKQIVIDNFQVVERQPCQQNNVAFLGGGLSCNNEDLRPIQIQLPDENTWFIKYQTNEGIVEERVSSSPFNIQPSDTNTFTFLSVYNTCFIDTNVVIHVERSNSIEVWNTHFLCEGQSIQVGYNTYYNAGNYVDTLIAVSTGCDSIVHSTLNYYPTYELAMQQTICSGDSVVFNQMAYYQSGVYTERLQTINGCDSTLILTLDVINSNAEIIDLNGGTYWVDAPEAEMINWYNCNTEEWYALGDTVNLFINGNYRAEISTMNDCIFLTNCIEISDQPFEVDVFPNPTSTEVTLRAHGVIMDRIELFTPLGLLVESIQVNAGQMTLSVADLIAGVYTINIWAGSDQITRRIVVF